MQASRLSGSGSPSAPVWRPPAASVPSTTLSQGAPLPAFLAAFGQPQQQQDSLAAAAAARQAAPAVPPGLISTQQQPASPQGADWSSGLQSSAPPPSSAQQQVPAPNFPFAQVSAAASGAAEASHQQQQQAPIGSGQSLSAGSPALGTSFQGGMIDSPRRSKRGRQEGQEVSAAVQQQAEERR